MFQADRLRRGFVFAIFLAGLSGATAAGDWSELTRLLPESTNAVLAIDVEALFDSPLAKANHWREIESKQFEDQITMLPPGVARFVLAVGLDLEHLEPDWEFAAMKLVQPVDIERVQAAIGGQLDSLAGLRAIRTTRESFIVPFDAQRVGLIRIAPRAWAAQQVRHAQTRPAANCTPFLVNAVERASQQTQIVMAVHLEDVLPVEAIRASVARSTLLAGADVSAEGLTAMFSTLEGFEFSIRVTDKVYGKLEMVFRSPPQVLAKIGKSVMINMLDTAGSGLPEFAGWAAAQTDNSLSIEGELTLDGLGKMMSLLHYDMSDIDPLGGAVSPPLDRRDVATARYIQSVTRLVNSLAVAAKSNNLGAQVLWTDRTAKAIMRRSTKDVRSDVVEMGNQIAYQLAEIVAAFNNAASTAAVLSSSEAKPMIQWRTQLVPYESYKTPYGRFYRYLPLSVAQVNVGENLERSRQFAAQELVRANAAATTKFREIQTKVNEMASLVGPK